MYNYKIDSQIISSSTDQCDLRIRAHTLLMFKRKQNSISNTMILWLLPLCGLLYKMYVRPLLEFAGLTSNGIAINWSLFSVVSLPYHSKGPSYEDRLNLLDIRNFLYVTAAWNVWCWSFNRVHPQHKQPRTEESSFQVLHKKALSEQQSIIGWNQLPRNVVNSLYVNSFRNSYDIKSRSIIQAKMCFLSEVATRTSVSTRLLSTCTRLASSLESYEVALGKERVWGVQRRIIRLIGDLTLTCHLQRFLISVRLVTSHFSTDIQKDSAIRSSRL
nr:unnamed protein product [Callosobruchus chinensis]